MPRVSKYPGLCVFRVIRSQNFGPISAFNQIPRKENVPIAEHYITACTESPHWECTLGSGQSHNNCYPPSECVTWQQQCCYPPKFQTMIDFNAASGRSILMFGDRYFAMLGMRSLAGSSGWALVSVVAKWTDPVQLAPDDLCGGDDGVGSVPHQLVPLPVPDVSPHPAKHCNHTTHASLSLEFAASFSFIFLVFIYCRHWRRIWRK